ncbi:MAG: hypothetical protein IJ113_05260 [Eggerthellaceae bacterium]|nr:hypothetical protein [Eggerthellaceae bacterium]
MVCIESLQVRADRVRAHVSCSPSVRMTTPELAHKVCELRPLLPKHACVNGKGSTFAAVIQHTPIIHLLEHVVVDILTEQSSATDKIFVGTSEWVDYDAGRGRVEVSYCDDLEAIAAFKSAEELINTLL